MKLLFLDGTKGFSPHRLNEKPTGGIITSLTIIPQYFAKQGYDVYVFSTYEKEETENGVKYINKLIDNADVVVFNRNAINKFAVEHFKNSKKIWWLHDIVQTSYLEDDAFKKVDKIVALSQYCKDSYSDFYDIPENKFIVIPNGVDTERFYHSDKARNKNLFICASAPVKGLQPLEFVFHNLRRNNPDVRLMVFSGQKLHDLEETYQTQLDNLKRAGIEVYDPIPQNNLAVLMREACCLLMPNSYPEICSNLLLQAQSCGCPVITSPIGSAKEFIQHGVNGLLTKTYPHDIFWWWKEFALLSVNVMIDDGFRAGISGRSNIKVMDWVQICDIWENMIKEIV